MMFRTTLLAAAVTGALGGFAMMAAPASAAPVAAPAGQTAQAGQGLIEQAQYYYRGPRRYYGPRPYYRPRCFWSERRVWNGWRWVIRPVRVCR
ncbi:hypothetical protein FQV39_12085 [Bosea sp. F3-2]|uniref:hypothetical protein n=1 Tax=Bosea sp. F3-2 TaxID=2599640 RepID=UPI0011EECF90|nr:hypothetical protein [Bosea sp. F3-2]QEL23229.1 hypothetical protein FQV39_12085 [Bosea sp. F3-2]